MSSLVSLPRALVLESGQWYERFTDGASVEPIFQLLRDVYALNYLLHDADVPEQLEYWLSRWQRERRRNLEHVNVLYLGFHGSPGKIWLDRQSRSLTELAPMLGDVVQGKVVHFASCSTLRVSTQRLRAFLDETGARAISGYHRRSEFRESTCVELLYLSRLGEYEKLPSLYKKMRHSVPGLLQSEGFRLVTPTFDSWEDDQDTEAAQPQRRAGAAGGQ